MDGHQLEEPTLNRGVELMLRNKKIQQEEEPSIFKICMRKVISCFYKECHFSFEFKIKNKSI